MSKAKFDDEDKAWWYGLWHVHHGSLFFGAEDLQRTARMERLGLVELNPDYDGFNIIPTKAAKPLEKISATWEKFWFKKYG
jgi:hypothetical protein